MIDYNAIREICHDCATARGWKPVNKPVGIWTGTCPVCKQEKPLTADRDYIRPNEKRLTTTEALVALYQHQLDNNNIARSDNNATGDKK